MRPNRLVDDKTVCIHRTFSPKVVNVRAKHHMHLQM